MLKSIIGIGAALIMAVSAFGLSVQGKFSGVDPFTMWKPIPEPDAEFNQAFQQEFLDISNRMRHQFAVSSLKSDMNLQSVISEKFQRHPSPDSIELNAIFDSLQSKFPGAQYLAANLVSASSREDLISQLMDWDELSHPEFDVVNTSVTRSGRKLVAIGILSRRIPRFCLDQANCGSSTRFYNECPHCGSVHALDLQRKNKTLILSCPDCEAPYDVIAAGSDGRMRRANDFFTGFRLPVNPNADKKQQVISIWNDVANRCSYEHDHLKSNHSEVWKTSEATWIEKLGDCEDTSILLVDSLISAGFEARVAIGWNGNIGQHAWAVLRVDGEEFVLESTIQENPGLSDLVPVKDASPFYRPEQLFDRENLYFQNASPEEVAMNYFEDTMWKRVSWH